MALKPRFNPITTEFEWVESFDPRVESELFDDFQLNAYEGNWRLSVSGAAAGQATPPAGSNSEVGIVSLSTGTTATGYAFLNTNAALNSIRLGANPVSVEIKATHYALSAVADEYWTYCGLGDGFIAGTLPVDGVGFLYDRLNYGNYWVCVTSSNSSRTLTVLDGTSGNPTNAVVALTYNKLRAEVNAAASQVDFYIDNVLVKSHTTNIPSGAGREMSEGMGICRTAYSGLGRYLYADWYRRRVRFTTPR